MWKKYNRWLIECTKKAKTNESDLELLSFITGGFAGFTFLTFFLPLIVHIFIATGFLITVVYQAFKQSANVKLRAIDAAGYYLSFITPFSSKRNSIIEEYLIHLAKIKGENPLTSNLFLERPSFRVIEKDNLHSWIKTFIGTEKSLIPLISERVLGCSHMREGLLFWSQLIPKEKLLFDDFKTLLLINPIKNKEQLLCLRNFPENNLNTYFNNYTSCDIKRLFTSSFYLNDYLEILNIAGRYDLVLDKKKDMEELRIWAQMMEAAYQGSHFHFPCTSPQVKIIPDTPCSLGMITPIDNVAKLDWWARALNNCLMSYQRKALCQEGYLFGIYQDGKPWAAFYINPEFHLIEFKRKANGEVNSDQRGELERVLRVVKPKI